MTKTEILKTYYMLLKANKRKPSYRDLAAKGFTYAKIRHNIGPLACIHKLFSAEITKYVPKVETCEDIVRKLLRA